MKSKKEVRKLLYNAICTPDGTVLESRHRHDFRQHRDKKTGKLYGIDGGLDYRRRSGPEDYEDISIIWEPNMPHDTLRDYLKWASYGKNGKGPVRYILLKDLDTDHINNILDTQRDLDAFYAKALFAELDFRGVTQDQ